MSDELELSSAEPGASFDSLVNVLGGGAVADSARDDTSSMEKATVAKEESYEEASETMVQHNTAKKNSPVMEILLANPNMNKDDTGMIMSGKISSALAKQLYKDCVLLYDHEFKGIVCAAGTKQEKKLKGFSGYKKVLGEYTQEEQKAASVFISKEFIIKHAPNIFPALPG